MKKVILIGDSIRMAYQPLVAEKLQDTFDVWGPEENGGTSANVLAHLDEWVIRREPDVVHLNCGLHDLVIEPDGRYRAAIGEYGRNLRRILERLKEETGARLIWATTTPVIDERHRRNKTFTRYERDVERYNAVALSVTSEAGIEIDDLHAVIVDAGPERCIRDDGVHMTGFGNESLADAVARCIRGTN